MDGPARKLARSAALDAAALAGRPPGVWRYRDAIPLPPDVQPVTLGEPATPVIQVELDGARPWLKLDYLFPTGSYKDRGATVLVSLLRAAGRTHVLEDSSGNAGSAIAAYCAAAGIACEIYAPATASPGKLVQIAAYGATVHTIAGTREDVTAAALAAAAHTFYASHYWNPFFNEGTKTMAFEAWEQLGRAPDVAVLPCGHGSVVLGAAMGFAELHAAGLIPRVPRIVAVQAQAVDPLHRMFHESLPSPPVVAASATAAEGIATRHPLRWREILAAVRDSGGTFVSVTEPGIAHAVTWAARRGLLIEPTSAAAIAGYREAIVSRAVTPRETALVVLTGHGLKDPQTALDHAGEVLACEAELAAVYLRKMQKKRRERIESEDFSDDMCLACGAEIPRWIGKRMQAFGDDVESVREFAAYLGTLIADRRKHPGDPEHDVLTRLIQGEEAGEKLSETELLQNCVFILNAGHETTTNLDHEVVSKQTCMREVTVRFANGLYESLVQVNGSVTIMQTKRAVFNGVPCQTVITSTTERDVAKLTEVNVHMSQDLWRWCAKHKVPLVYASSAATYGDGSRGYSDGDSVTPPREPLNLYGASKQWFDLWAPQTGALNFQRQFDAIQAAQIAKIYGMRGLVLKEHTTETGSWAYLVSQVVPGIEVFGGIVLNRYVGGMNPAAVEAIVGVWEALRHPGETLGETVRRVGLEGFAANMTSGSPGQSRSRALSRSMPVVSGSASSLTTMCAGSFSSRHSASVGDCTCSARKHAGTRRPSADGRYDATAA